MPALYAASFSILAIKLLLAPAGIGVASWIGRRRGPAAAGWFAALPLTSAPVLLVLALERGTTFAAEACVGILLAIVSLAVFALVYERASVRWGWATSAVVGCVAYLACSVLLQRLPVSLETAFVLVCVLLAVVVRLMPHADHATPTDRPLAGDIPLRMALTAILVFVVTQTAGVLGPRLSGLLTPFPIAATILVSFTHRRNGGAAAVALLRALIVGLISFAVFFLVAGELLVRRGIGNAFVAAVLCTLAIHGAVGVLLQCFTTESPGSVA